MKFVSKNLILNVKLIFSIKKDYLKDYLKSFVLVNDTISRL